MQRCKGLLQLLRLFRYELTHTGEHRRCMRRVMAVGIVGDCKELLFRTIRGRSGVLTGNSLLQSDVWQMIRCRALTTGIKTEIGCHTFRSTGITTYLVHGGKLEIARHIAAHESSRTTGLYDRRSDEVSL